MYYRKTIISCAEKYVGIKEGSATHKKIIDRYNNKTPRPRGYKVTYKDAWCMTGVSSVAIECGYEKIFPIECGCQEAIKLSKNMGCWVENDNYIPIGGDVIYYDWQDNGSGDNKGYSDHVGIVQKVVNNIIYVIEFNYNDMCKIRTISVGGRYIRGYHVPKYDSYEKETEKKPPTTTDKKTETTTDKKTETSTSKLPSLKGYSGNSIVDGLKSVKYNSSFSSREKIWKQLGKTDKYKGTAKQNLEMIKLLGGTVDELPKLKGYKGYSIVDALKSFGYNSSFSYRKNLWKMIGKTTTYKGTSKQNLELLEILKRG